MFRFSLTVSLIFSLSACAVNTSSADAWYESAQASCDYQHRGNFEARAACNIAAWLSYGRKLRMDVEKIRAGGDRACNELYRNRSDLIPVCFELVRTHVMSYLDEIEVVQREERRTRQKRNNALIMRCAAEGGSPDFVNNACI